MMTWRNGRRVWLVTMAAWGIGMDAGNVRAATLHWSGEVNTNWDKTTANWRTLPPNGGTNNGTQTTYTDGDNVVFHNYPTKGTFVPNTCNVAVAVSPGSVLVANSTDYSPGGGVDNLNNEWLFTGAEIGGNYDIQKNGNRGTAFKNPLSHRNTRFYNTGGGINNTSVDPDRPGNAYTPSSGGPLFGLGTGVIDTKMTLKFGPDSGSGTLTNDIIVNGTSSGLFSPSSNVTFNGKITVSNTTGFAIPAAKFLVATNQGLFLTTNLTIGSVGSPAGSTINSMIIGTNCDITLPAGGNADWRCRLSGNGGWKVQNVVKLGHSSLEVFDNPAAFFTNITGKVSVQAGVVERAYNTTPTGIYDITAWYELLVTAAQTQYPTGTVRAATINVTGGGTVSGIGRLLCTTANIGTAGTVGTLSPGTNTPGTLYVQGNLVLGPNAVLNFDLGTPGVTGGGTNDLLNVTGNVTVNGGTVNITATNGFGEGTNTLITYTVSYSGSTNLVMGTVPNHYRCTITNDATAKAIKVVNKLSLRGTGVVLE